MPKSICKFDFSDIRPAFSKFNRQVRKKVEEVGKEAVEYAIENGDYQDVSGKTRASNHYEVDQNNNLTLYNDCGYADELEANGKDVIGGAALFAEQKLREAFKK